MSEPHRIIYFQPGQLLFHVNGNIKTSPARDALIQWANSLAEKGKKKVKISPDPEVFDFNPSQIDDPQGAISRPTSKSTILSKIDGSPSDQPPGSAHSPADPKVKYPPPFALVFANVTRLNDPVDSMDPQALTELLDLAVFLDNEREGAPVKLEVVSLNWLMSGSSQPGATGGPGTSPIYVEHKDVRKNTFKANINPVQLGDGGGVAVAILDTSYSEQELEDIYKKWVLDISQPGDRHPLVDSLLSGALRDSNGQLRVNLDPAVNNYLPGIEIDGHNYNMTDHGLFVAGIINSLAPMAELHLYQVLNKNGIGDLRSIARALKMITTAFQHKQLVVNLSLTMNIPLEDEHCRDDDDFHIGHWILRHKPSWFARLIQNILRWIFGKQVVCWCETWFDRQARPFEWICDLIYSLDSRVIAAAGNYNKIGRKRPQALYPAAFHRVLGVGALPKDIPQSTTAQVKTASYSNLADTPPRTGLTTLGGETGEGNGVLGVYVGKIPNNGPVNDTGWAWWAGTSFATPIISGLTASVLSILNQTSGGGTNTNPRSSTQDAINVLFNAQTLLTNDNEDVLTVTQG